MRPTSTSRVDMHCHSTASQVSKLGAQRALGLPECATLPEEVYELAKRRGMDFVTITDHDTIAGALAIADRPDVFLSEELTADFKGEAQQVHVLCYGITPSDHEWLQAHAGDVEVVADYLHSNEITCALAHPFYAVGAPLTARHRRRLAQLFPVWEVRNGSRARELNLPAAVYIDTHGGTGIGGTDDHAGVDIGRTWTQSPKASTPAEFLAHVRAGEVQAKGRAGLSREVGPRRHGDRRASAGGGRGRHRSRPRRCAEDGRAGDDRGRRAVGLDRHRPRPRRCARAVARLAGRHRPRGHRTGAAHPPAGRGLLPRRSVPARPPLPRAQAADRRGPRARGSRARGRGRLGRRRPRALRGVRRRGALRTRRGLPRAREGQAQHPRARAAARRASRRRGRRHARRHPHLRRDPRARRAQASRSRSSAQTPKWIAV